MRMMAIVEKVRKFIQEPGPDFCFMKVKKRLVETLLAPLTEIR